MPTCIDIAPTAWICSSGPWCCARAHILNRQCRETPSKACIDWVFVRKQTVSSATKHLAGYMAVWTQPKRRLPHCARCYLRAGWRQRKDARCVHINFLQRFWLVKAAEIVGAVRTQDVCVGKRNVGHQICCWHKVAVAFTSKHTRPLAYLWGQFCVWFAQGQKTDYELGEKKKKQRKTSKFASCVTLGKVFWKSVQVVRLFCLTLWRCESSQWTSQLVSQSVNHGTQNQSLKACEGEGVQCFNRCWRWLFSWATRISANTKILPEARRKQKFHFWSKVRVVMRPVHQNKRILKFSIEPAANRFRRLGAVTPCVLYDEAVPKCLWHAWSVKCFVVQHRLEIDQCQSSQINSLSKQLEKSGWNIGSLLSFGALLK